MDIAMDDPNAVQMGNCTRHLTEQIQKRLSAELNLAELLPVADMVGAFGAEDQGLALVNDVHGLQQIQQVGVLSLLKLHHILGGSLRLRLQNVAQVNEGQQVELLTRRRPLDGDFAVV